MKIRANRRAIMADRTVLTRRARTILAMDALLMAADDDPSRVTRQDIAARAMEWTTDEVTIFADEETGDDEGRFDDYYSIINDLMRIVTMMNRGEE